MKEKWKDETHFFLKKKSMIQSALMFVNQYKSKRAKKSCFYFARKQALKLNKHYEREYAKAKSTCGTFGKFG